MMIFRLFFSFAFSFKLADGFIYELHAQTSRPYRQINKLNFSYKIAENTVYGVFNTHKNGSHARLKRGISNEVI